MQLPWTRIGPLLALITACARPAPTPIASSGPPPAIPSQPTPLEAPEPDPIPEPAPAPAVLRNQTPASALGCGDLGVLPEIRTGGGLTVRAVPDKRKLELSFRMRGHTDGSLTARSSRTWVGPPVPTWVPLTSGTLELFLLDPSAGGYFAMYRDPYDAGSCKLSAHDNCAYEIVRFDCSGKQLYRVSLAKFFSRKDQLEVQDARLDGNTVYFNEACQSYSREAKGKCSSLVALDPVAKKVLWRTPSLTSNSRILVLEKYIVSGYGFTAEDDYLFVVRKKDGKVMQKISLPQAAEDIIDADNALVAQIDSGRGLMYRKDGFDGDSPKLELMTALIKSAPNP
jgi:hypothetical protein